MKKYMWIGLAFLAGVAFGDFIKPMLSKIPLIGSFFAPKGGTSTNEGPVA